VWACTSGSFVFGAEGAQDQAAELTRVDGCPASSTSLAFVHAARALGVRRVAVAATYPDELAQHFRTFLGAAGFDVVRFAGHGVPTAADAGLLGRDDVLDMTAVNDDPDADAVLLPDTALHTVTWLDELEQRAGKPVLTANQVSAWEGLRLAGRVPSGVAGLGTLFAGIPASARR
jgi:maleate cis-trans isomerase